MDETEATKRVAGDDNGVYVNNISIVVMNKPDGRFCNKNNGWSELNPLSCENLEVEELIFAAELMRALAALK